ncbi:hypothetical protein P5673_005863 [Acropora cervicornis]|uniref:Uncharacterized protein n=1 Tax=Acropora cervicornis TaxID=6130 RepID=A0AAD9QZI2_ACRCE|nr:hypothetical protein P5673_005863 [Acropora cervicornis]
MSEEHEKTIRLLEPKCLWSQLSYPWDAPQAPKIGRLLEPVTLIFVRHEYYQPSKIVDDNARICMWVDYKPIDELLAAATKARKLQA